ncbi:MAG: hypothetical protein JXQ90_00705 [Cyclobacteriaceae bacterium]
MYKCTNGKVIFNSTDEAEIELKRLKNLYVSSAVDYYKCEICGAYHLTSKGGMNSLEQNKGSDENRKIIESDYWERKFR